MSIAVPIHTVAVKKWFYRYRPNHTEQSALFQALCTNNDREKNAVPVRARYREVTCCKDNKIPITKDQVKRCKQVIGAPLGNKVLCYDGRAGGDKTRVRIPGFHMVGCFI